MKRLLKTGFSGNTQIYDISKASQREHLAISKLVMLADKSLHSIVDPGPGIWFHLVPLIPLTYQIQSAFVQQNIYFIIKNKL